MANTTARDQYLQSQKVLQIGKQPSGATFAWYDSKGAAQSKSLSAMTSADWASANYTYDAKTKIATPIGQTAAPQAVPPIQTAPRTPAVSAEQQARVERLKKAGFSDKVISDYLAQLSAASPAPKPSTGLLPSSPMSPPPVSPAIAALPADVQAKLPAEWTTPKTTPPIGVPASAQAGNIPTPGAAATVIDLLRGNTIGDQLGYLKQYGAPLRSAILESFPEFASLDKYYQERMAQPLSQQMTEDFLQNYGRATSMAGWGEYATSPGLPFQAAMSLSALQEQARAGIAGQYQQFSGNLLGMTGLFNDYTGQYLSYLTAQTQAGLGQSQFQQSLALQQKQFEAELKAAQEQSDLIKQQLSKSEKELEEFKRTQQVANMPNLPQWGPSNMAQGVTTMPGTSKALADLRNSIYSQNIYGWAPAGSGGYSGYW